MAKTKGLEVSAALRQLCWLRERQVSPRWREHGVSGAVGAAAPSSLSLGNQRHEGLKQNREARPKTTRRRGEP